MSTSQADLEKEFQQHNWNEDKEWQNIVTNMDFPPNYDDSKKEEFLLKRKRKYYREKVNRSYIPPPETSSTPKRSTPRVVEEPADNSQNTREQRPNGSSSRSEPSTRNTGPKTTSNNRSTKISPASFFQRALNSFFLASQWLFLILGLLSVLIPALYYRAVLLIALVHIVALVQNTGLPKWDRSYMERIFRDENSLIAFQAGALLLGPPSMLLISPNLLRSLYMGSHLLNMVLNNSTGLYGKIHAVLGPYLNKVTSQLSWFTNSIALLEVCVGIYLIFSILITRTFMTVLLYWQILSAKYMLNPTTKYAFAQINQVIEGNLQRIPAVLNIYRKLTSFMYSMVDPQQLAARQAQSGTRNCVIM